MKKPKFIPEFKDIPTGRGKMPELPLEERTGNFDEVELGFTEEMALAEAARCLSCRRCIGCGLCLAECDREAVVYDETSERLTLEADSIIFTSDGAPYDPGGKRELGYTASANVITSLEFERLASPTGPFGGYILRPFDGERPRRIAFVQCVGSREEGIGANYCSTTCCSRTFSQARVARKHLGKVAVTVFHRGLRPTGKRSEVELTELKAADWMSFIEAAIDGITEDAETGVVKIAYTAGEKAGEAEFDLVVLAVGINSKSEFRRLARAGGLKTNKYGFAGRGLAALVGEAPGVTFAGAIGGPLSDAGSVVEAIAAAGRSLTSGVSPERAEPPHGNGWPGIFACGYGLGLAGKDVDLVEGLEAKGITVDGVYPFLCYKEGRLAMAAKAKEAGHLVVLGCHSGSHESLFERVLGVEQGKVAIVGIDEIAARAGEKIKALIEDLPRTLKDAGRKVKRVAVIGSGTSGLAAASELLRRGLEVTLIEQSDKMGTSFLEAFRDSGGETEVAEGFVKAVEAHPKAKVLLASTVTSCDRSDGKLLLEVTAAGGSETVEAGAVLAATGAGRYEPAEYPYGKHEAVINQWELTSMIGEGKTDRKKLVMIQCVGARDGEHRYCSRYCCKQALANALLYKSNNPDAQVTILHKGIRVFGFEEDLLTDAMDQGVKCVKIDGRAEITGGKTLKVRAVLDSRTGGGLMQEAKPEAGGGSLKQGAKSGALGEIALDADLVVLSLAHHHGPGQKELSRTLAAPLDELGFFASDNPLSEPFRTCAAGVFVCGFARHPVVAEEAYVEGVGAAGAIWSWLMT
jgi:heterodisulfide reductase subunit A-like polyferredoxin